MRLAWFLVGWYSAALYYGWRPGPVLLAFCLACGVAGLVIGCL